MTEYDPYEAHLQEYIEQMYAVPPDPEAEARWLIDDTDWPSLLKWAEDFDR